jgi:hypothetical protein
LIEETSPTLHQKLADQISLKKWLPYNKQSHKQILIWFPDNLVNKLDYNPIRRVVGYSGLPVHNLGKILDLPGLKLGAVAVASIGGATVAEVEANPRPKGWGDEAVELIDSFFAKYLRMQSWWWVGFITLLRFWLQTSFWGDFQERQVHVGCFVQVVKISSMNNWQTSNITNDRPNTGPFGIRMVF